MNVNEAYDVVTQEESQRTLGVGGSSRDPLTLLAGRTYPHKHKKLVFGEACGNCGYKGHVTEDCYRIVGYPHDFKSKKKGNGQGTNKPAANVTTTNENCNTQSSTHIEGSNTRGHYLTDDQYQQWLGSRPSTSDCTSNMAGMLFKLSNAHRWIVDTRALHHITPYNEILEAIRNIKEFQSRKVQVPIGGRCSIASIGDAKILRDHILKDVLYVPEFKCSLLSVSKIIKELRCSVLFFPEFCIF
ncbi:hypothetical protein RND71_031638 [Anisodus tanguticus]|uniref:CCHC-type domain-containing protein n=1 Tax=Anisodus tanguticus TaxID=243964 RepID=A0AAE1RC62_9SOLA|nr:hypothetical protein RND71_031638 [Anisodus tanguticus]